MSMIVSVVVPTFHREKRLAQCLQMLLAQDSDPACYEIVVADDGPSEEAREVVESFRRPSGPRLIYLPVTATQGPAAARNAGWRKASAPLIAFTDDDCLPDKHWLSAGLAAMNATQADAATGRTVVPLPERPTDYERDIAGLATAEFVTANCFCRRDILEAIGGFDEQFTAAWREDSDLHFALLERNRKIVRAEDAVVVHPAHRGPWAASIWKQRRGVFDPLLYRKHPELYRQRIHPLPRSYYLAIVALLAAGLGLQAASAAVAWSGILVWCGVTMNFTRWRLRGCSRSLKHVSEMLVSSALIPPLSVYWRIRGAVRYGVFYL